VKKLTQAHTESYKGWNIIGKHYEKRFLSGEVVHSVEISVRPGKAVIQKLYGTTYSTPHFDSIRDAKKWIDDSAPHKAEAP